MTILCCVFFYYGLMQNINNVLFPTCIGFNHQFGDYRKGIANMSQVMIALGHMFGGGLYIFFGKFLDKLGRSFSIIISSSVTMACYGSLLLNFPKECVLGETTNTNSAIIESDILLALVTSFLSGTAESCFYVQMIALIR